MENVLKETRLLVNKIISFYKPEKIILFGSLARGENHANPDIDLLIIKKSKKKRPFRVKEVFEAIRGFERNYPLDPIVYTPEELKKRLSLGDYFIQRILREGKLLYG